MGFLLRLGGRRILSGHAGAKRARTSNRRDGAHDPPWQLTGASLPPDNKLLASGQLTKTELILLCATGLVAVGLITGNGEVLTVVATMITMALFVLAMQLLFSFMILHNIPLYAEG